MLRRIAFIGLTAATLALGACSSTPDTTPTGAQRASEIPWNRPQSWEGAGVYGSALNQGR